MPDSPRRRPPPSADQPIGTRYEPSSGCVESMARFSLELDGFTPTRLGAAARLNFATRMSMRPPTMASEAARPSKTALLTGERMDRTYLVRSPTPRGSLDRYHFPRNGLATG